MQRNDNYHMIRFNPRAQQSRTQIKLIINSLGVVQCLKVNLFFKNLNFISVCNKNIMCHNYELLFMDQKGNPKVYIVS